MMISVSRAIIKAIKDAMMIAIITTKTVPVAFLFSIPISTITIMALVVVILKKSDR